MSDPPGAPGIEPPALQEEEDAEAEEEEEEGCRTREALR